MKLWLKILICVISVLILGSSGSIFPSSQIANWYAGLEKPPGVPPNWLFSPVWIVLYITMGISLALFLHFVPVGKAKETALAWFAVQLALNLSWSPVFFGAKQIALGVIVIVALLASLLVTIVLFRREHRWSGRLLIPYAIWVGYATYLNIGYWVVN